jgi:hypothetical protein
VAAYLNDVLLGTDFPNIPYEYAHQLAALERLASVTTGCVVCCGAMPPGCCRFPTW